MKAPVVGSVGRDTPSPIRHGRHRRLLPPPSSLSGTDHPLPGPQPPAAGNTAPWTGPRGKEKATAALLRLGVVRGLRLHQGCTSRRTNQKDFCTATGAPAVFKGVTLTNQSFRWCSIGGAGGIQPH